MSIFSEERLSDSPLIETVTRGYTVGDSASLALRPAENHWHMVLSKRANVTQLLVVGALTKAGPLFYEDGAELLWIKFKLGAFMPHLPAKTILDTETPLPGATSNSFWLRGAAWQFPDFENVDTFANRLARESIVLSDNLVDAALQDHLPATPERTVRHRFLQSTGLTQSHIRQGSRAQQAAQLLRDGKSILDVVYELGYCDQSHLTHAVRRFVGYTPVQLSRQADAV